MYRWLMPGAGEPVRSKVAATVPPPAAELHERARLGAAAYHAKRLLPPAVGQLLARELGAAERFGFLAPDGLVWQAAAELIDLANRDGGDCWGHCGAERPKGDAA